jgi:hypothetical protein
MLITMAVLMVILCIYTEHTIVKTGVYVFITSLIIVFIHNKVLLVDHHSRVHNSEEVAIVNNIKTGRGPVDGGWNGYGADDLGYLNTM